MNDVPSATGFRTRLIVPIWFAEGGRVDDDVAALTKIELRLGKETAALWIRAEPDHLFTEELLPQAVRALFGSAGSRAGRYLRVNPDYIGRLNGGTDLVIGAPAVLGGKTHVTNFPALPATRIERIELFLSGFTVGLLVLDLNPAPAEFPLPIKTLQGWLYWLSQRRPWRAPTLRQPHPWDDFADLEKLPEKLQKAQPPPVVTAPLDARLTRRGGSFTLPELCQFLIPEAVGSPYGNEAITLIHPFSHHTVVRFPKAIEFHSPAGARSINVALAAITQIEEPTHAEALADEMPVAWLTMNTRHLVAVGTNGATHFVADQSEPPAGFDGQRLAVIHEKYFMGYLLASVQSHFLQRAVVYNTRQVDLIAEEQRQRMSAATAGVHEFETAGVIIGRRGVLSLRTQIADFDTAWMLVNSSLREAHNRYYRLCGEALRVASSLENVRRSLADLDAIYRQQAQVETNVQLLALARQSSGDQQRMLTMQSKLEWVEIFLIGVYAVYLLNYLGENFGFAHGYIAWSIVVGTIYAWTASACIFTPWKHPQAHAKKSIHETSAGRAITLLLLPVLLPLSIYLGIGMTFFTSAVKPAYEAHPKAAESPEKTLEKRHPTYEKPTASPKPATKAQSESK